MGERQNCALRRTETLAAVPSEHQKETTFLRRCISYEEGAQGRQLDERIAQIQRDERCLRRAAWVVGLVAALAVVGFGYLAILMEDFPRHMSLFAVQFLTKVVFAMGIGSLISLLIFSGFAIRYRWELNLRREECRRLVTKLLESRLGNLQAPRGNGELKKANTRALRNELAAPTTENKDPALQP